MTGRRARLVEWDMRGLLLITIAIVAACGGNRPGVEPPPPSGPQPRMDLHCTPQPDFDEAACTGRGCTYGPPLICRGIDVDDETRDREREAEASGGLPCTCVCPSDLEACAMVP